MWKTRVEILIILKSLKKDISPFLDFHSNVFWLFYSYFWVHKIITFNCGGGGEKWTVSTKLNPLCKKTIALLYYCPGTLLDKLSVPQRNLLNDSATSPLNEHTLDSFFCWRERGGARRTSCYCCTDLIIELHYCFIRVCVEKKYIVWLKKKWYFRPVR